MFAIFNVVLDKQFLAIASERDWTFVKIDFEHEICIQQQLEKTF